MTTSSDVEELKHMLEFMREGFYEWPEEIEKMERLLHAVKERNRNHQLIRPTEQFLQRWKRHYKKEK